MLHLNHIKIGINLYDYYTLTEGKNRFTAMHLVNAGLGENNSNQNIKIMTIVKIIQFSDSIQTY